MRLGVDAALLPDVTLLMVDGDTFISFAFNLQTVSRTDEPKHDATPQPALRHQREASESQTGATDAGGCGRGYNKKAAPTFHFMKRKQS